MRVLKAEVDLRIQLRFFFPCLLVHSGSFLRRGCWVGTVGSICKKGRKSRSPAERRSCQNLPEPPSSPSPLLSAHFPVFWLNFQSDSVSVHLFKKSWTFFFLHPSHPALFYRLSPVEFQSTIVEVSLQHPLVLHSLVVVLLLSVAAGGAWRTSRQGGGAGQRLTVAIH